MTPQHTQKKPTLIVVHDRKGSPPSEVALPLVWAECVFVIPATDASRGIANPLVEVVNFVSRRANVFHESTPPIYRLNPHLGFELTELLGLADPRPHVNLRIRDGHG